MVSASHGLRKFDTQAHTIISARQFTCSLTQAKRSFNRSFNAIFGGKIGRLASEEVILELVESKCLPVLLRGGGSDLARGYMSGIYMSSNH